MNAVLILLTLIVCGLIVFVAPSLILTHGGGFTSFRTDYEPVTVLVTSKAVLLCAGFALIAGFLSYRRENGSFLLKIFLAALLVRMVIAAAIYVFKAQEFFGGDAVTYDVYGWAQMLGWGGDKFQQSIAARFVRGEMGSGWGMVYFVAAIYRIVGRNMLAVQLVNCVFGAATAITIFLCAHHIFNNLRVARFASVAVAFYPSLVLWSSQGLKDGPIVFFLTLAILATLKLGEKLTLKHLAILVVSLLALLSFRFYVFYIACLAIGGAFVIGLQTITPTSFVRQFAVIILLGLALMYLGVTRSATTQFREYGNLETVQRSRADLATSAESGFGKDVDVSTTVGALGVIPLGLLYLLFAPFPWQLVSLRQSITLPEMIVWWASFPLLVLGMWFAIRYRLRMISPILIFTVMLTLAYSVFQGNVGTAYRQRAQLLVFYFIFVSVGLTLVLEKREERKRFRQQKRDEWAAERAATFGRRAAKSADS
ncbi:MAG TPA: glycosyltransferase family 39 protein [Pyrinomonadaceae bacterium]|nr:glycosyltransferase family 39 protein [Pyrinomonadaceae bacterium]